MFKAMLETEDKEKSEIFLISKSSRPRMKYLLSSSSFSSSPLNTMNINNRNVDFLLWEYQGEKHKQAVNSQSLGIGVRVLKDKRDLYKERRVYWAEGRPRMKAKRQEKAKSL